MRAGAGTSLFAAALAALSIAGCGSGGGASGPTAPAAGPGPTVVGGAAPRAAATGPPPEPAAARVAASTTRWLYVRDRSAVMVAPATAAYRAGLRDVTVPADLRGGRASVSEVRVVRQSASTAIVSWTVIDDRARTSLVAALALRGGRWRAVATVGD